MRRALLAEWPALSRLYGLHPWDVPRLTADELIAYRKHLHQTIDAQQRG